MPILFRCFTLLLCWFYFAGSSIAASIHCEKTASAWATLESPFELNVSQVNAAKNVHITLGKNIPAYTVLYTIAKVNVGNVYANCTLPVDDTGLHYTMFSSNYGAAVQTVGTDVIYPTSVSGIGISVAVQNMSGVAVPLFPGTNHWGTASNGYGFWVTVKIWRIPGTLPTGSGAFSFSGPTIGQVLKKPGYTFTSSDSGRITSGATGWIASSRVLKGTVMFQQTTCNLIMPSHTVNMGQFSISGGEQTSPWKDASFKLQCPNAYGYGGSVESGDGYTYPNHISPEANVAANSKRNNPIVIQVIPRYGFFNSSEGIIKLDGTGAKGYGIQLVWGTGSENPLNVVKPTILAAQLNSAYYGGTYTLNAPAFTVGADGTIKMAARYKRTSGTVQPGPANAVVEVVASYQ